MPSSIPVRNTTGTLALTKIGSGAQTLTGANTYNGATTINGGTLKLLGASALGAPSAITVNATGTLELNNNGANYGAPIGAVILNGGTLAYVSSGAFFIVPNTNPVTVSSASTISVSSGGGTAAGAGLFLDFGLKGSAALTVNASTLGALVLRNVKSDYSGALTVNGVASTAVGVGSGLAINGPTALSNASLTINGTLELGDSASGTGWALIAGVSTTSGLSTAIDALNGTGVIVANSKTAASTRTLSVGNTGGTGTFSGVLANGVNDTLSFTKTGAGPQTLSGVNTYTGGTAINGGILALGSAGALSTAGTISFAGGTLQFSAANTADYSARFSSAASQAYSLHTNGQTVTLATALSSVGGSLTKLGTGTLNLTAAQGYGTLNASGGTTNLSGTLGTGSSTLNASATVNITTSQTLAALNIADGVEVTFGDGLPFAGDGGKLTAGVVPEPGSLGLLCVGILGFCGRRRRA